MSTYFSAVVMAVGSVEAIEAARRELMVAEADRPAESLSISVLSVKDGLLAATFKSGKSRVDPQLGVLFGGDSGGRLGAECVCCYVVRDWENGCAARCFVDGVLKVKDRSEDDSSAWKAFEAACLERGIEAKTTFRD